MINDIIFSYVAGVDANETREFSMRNSVNMWLRELEQEINEQGDMVFIIFLSHDKQEFFINGVGFNLEKKIFEQINKFKNLT